MSVHRLPGASTAVERVVHSACRKPPCFARSGGPRWFSRWSQLYAPHRGGTARYCGFRPVPEQRHRRGRLRGRLQAGTPRSSEVWCSVPDFDVDDVLAGRVAKGVPQDRFALASDLFFYVVLLALPVAGPLVAFMVWRPLLAFVHYVLGDENKLLELTQMTLSPTTNGIVVASLSTALGTLTSITVWTLRTRQLDVRASLNKEACELKLLESTLIANLGSNDCDEMLYLQVLALIRMYVARIASESSSDVSIYELEQQGVGDTELTAIIRSIISAGVPQELCQEVTSRVTRMNDARSMRLAALSTAFPIIHWVILALLASSIALCFLIEVDQSEGRFLSERPEDSLRLRLVFTILVGTFSGLTSLCADLSDPFRGSFTIGLTTKQFTDMVFALDLDIARFRARIPNLDLERNTV